MKNRSSIFWLIVLCGFSVALASAPSKAQGPATAPSIAAPKPTPEPWSDEDPAAPWADARKIIGADFHRVASLPSVIPIAVFRGPRPSADGAIAALARAGVRQVINLQGGDGEIPLIGDIVIKFEPGEAQDRIDAERNAVEAAGMRFVNKPLISYLDVTKAEEKAIDEILDLMHDPVSLPVFVHCEHGHDRTGMIVALYRVLYDGWTIQKAHDEMVAMGHSGWIDQRITDPMDDYFYKEACRINARARKRDGKLAQDPACRRHHRFLDPEVPKGGTLMMWGWPARPSR